MLGTRDRRGRRRDATRAEILEAAWDLCRQHGLTGWSMRELGARVGMRAPSLYSYFAAKHDIYDALFAEGQAALNGRMADVAAAHVDDDVALLRAATHEYFAFCEEDPVRYQLLFQRTIPGFEPSPATWAVALEGFEGLRRLLARLGMGDQAMVDLYTALVTGLTSQQLANDPGGERWRRLLDDAVDMFLEHARKGNG